MWPGSCVPGIDSAVTAPSTLAEQLEDLTVGLAEQSGSPAATPFAGTRSKRAGRGYLTCRSRTSHSSDSSNALACSP
jgi:hypothetical protein